MVKVKFRYVLLTILCFVLDLLLADFIGYQLIFASLINFCLLPWRENSRLVYAFSIFCCIVLAHIQSYGTLSELLFLIFMYIIIKIIKDVFAESKWVTGGSTFLLCGLHAILVGGKSFWTIFGIIANILIIISMIHYDEVR